MKKKVIKAICFILGLCIMLGALQYVFVLNDARIYQIVSGFYDEKSKMDAVYVGASNVFAFFQAPLAWKDHGLAMYAYTVSHMPPYAVKDIIVECRKTQPDALYIISLNNFNDYELSPAKMHHLLDFMPFSKERIALTKKLTDIMGLNFVDSLEYYFPFIRYHTNWSHLGKLNFYRKPNGLKGGVQYSRFLKNSTDVTYYVKNTDEKAPLPEDIAASLQDLLQYCDDEKLNVLFVFSPQALNSEQDFTRYGFYNTVKEIVEQRGYPVLNGMDMTEEMGLLYSDDFYDRRHTNIHGSIKMTEFVADYVAENYDFVDKRNTAGYESWDRAAEAYVDIISSYVLDFELEHACRDYSLAKPGNPSKTTVGESNILTWDPVDGAQGYYIYRQKNNRPWERLEYTETCRYSDSGIETGIDYSYTVVPVRFENDITYYGSYHYDAKYKVDIPESIDSAATAD